MGGQNDCISLLIGHITYVIMKASTCQWVKAGRYLVHEHNPVAEANRGIEKAEAPSHASR
eukprot:XP_001708341.1 Hypothetical protein GL50803_115229 [Giardia lamblia ATCC 50803]